jgi:hypothetical protein
LENSEPKLWVNQKSLQFLRKVKMLLEELELISKIQKNLKDSYQSIGDAMIGGGIDNMDKYKYLLGQAHAYYKISQDISNLLKKKEPNNGKQDKENIIRFDATKN